MILGHRACSCHMTEGTQRIVHKFILWPLTLPFKNNPKICETRWFGKYAILQTIRFAYRGDNGYAPKWENEFWAN